MVVEVGNSEGKLVEKNGDYTHRPPEAAAAVAAARAVHLVCLNKAQRKEM